MAKPKLSPEEIKRANRAAARKARHARKAAEVAEQIALDAASEEGESKNETMTAAVAAKARGAESPKTVKQAREQLTQAFEDMGGIPALVRWGKKFPTDFYRLWARLIPKDAPPAEAAMPLEQLLAKLAERPDRTIAAAAMEIGEESMQEAAKKVSIEDAVAAFGRAEGESVN